MSKQVKCVTRGWLLCLASDGDVIVVKGRTPDFGRWLPFPAPGLQLTEDEAKTVVQAICEPASDGPPGFWRFISDPRTESDLCYQFGAKFTSAVLTMRKIAESGT